MARLNLTAKNSAERQVKKYLDENASETLAEKINTGKKTLSGAMAYCSKQAMKQASGGSAVVDDPTVYGWVIHYFEEEGEAEKVKGKREEVRGRRKKKPAPEQAPEDAPADPTFSRDVDFDDIDVLWSDEP